MRELQNIREVAALCPDFMGFIFYEKSKRFVGDDFFIPSDFPDTIKRVGVFVNEPVVSIGEKITKHHLDVVQLHGDEPPVHCKKLKLITQVVKAFQVDEFFDFNLTKPFVPFVDYFLFDTKSTSYGGSGKIFDWTLLRKYNEVVPFFLSGGISLDHIDTIANLKFKHLFAVDVNSGVESEPGVKDPVKVNSIIQAISFYS